MHNRGGKSWGSLDIGFIALPVLCALFVAMIFVSAEEDQAKKSATRAQEENLGRLRESLEQMKKELAELQAQREDLMKEIRALEETRQAEIMQSTLNELEDTIAKRKEQIKSLEAAVDETKMQLARKQELLKLIEERAKAIDELCKRVQELKDKSGRGKKDRNRSYLLGDYNGPYILLECDSEGAVVYPGKERMKMDAPQKKIDALLASVEATGFVALAVRPRGFDQSFDKFLNIVSAYIDKSKRTPGKKIGLSYFPIEGSESIENYIPGEGE